MACAGGVLPLRPPPVQEGILSFVQSGWGQAMGFARDANSRAQIAIGELARLSDMLGDLPTNNVEMDDVEVAISSLSIPAAPDRPQYPDAPERPSVSFEYGDEAGYTSESELLAVLRQVLSTWALGQSTGLAEAVEARLWARARAREHAASSRAIATAAIRAASLGWRRPPGAMYVDIARATQDERIALSGASREIAIKQAELEQSNRQFALGKAADVEQFLSVEYSQRMGRALDAAKFLPTLLIDIYKSGSEAYAAQINALAAILKADADVYQATIKGQADAIGSQAEVLKAKTEAAKSRAMIQIENAKATLEAMTKRMDVVMEATRGVAQVSAQLAAGAMSAINLSGGASASESHAESNSSNSSQAYSCTDTHIFNEG